MGLAVSERLVQRLLRKLEELTLSMEKANVVELIELFRHPWRLMTLNFLTGLVRGFGIGVGFTLATAAFLAILTRLAELNLPLIGRLVADITEIVQRELAVR